MSSSSAADADGDGAAGRDGRTEHFTDTRLHLGSGSYQVTAVSTGRWSCVLAPSPSRRFRVKTHAIRGQLLLEPGRGRRQDASQPSERGHATPEDDSWRHPREFAALTPPILKKCYCSRPQAAGACPYANICEQCDNFVPAPDAEAILTAQFDDITALRADAETRGWHDEAARHTRVAEAIQAHLDRLRRHHTNRPT
jgi:hypothetical protein